MTERPHKRAFTARPADPESWVKAPDPRFPRHGDAANFTARLTIDVTPDLRGRIKVTAFQRGQTVADMLRELLANAFPAEGDGQ